MSNNYPKPIRSLEVDEIKWFITLDKRPITKRELDEANEATEVYNGIKVRC